MEIPPSAKSRRFNENDVLGNLDRDEKGNVVTEEKDGNKIDKDGNPINDKGYLIDPSSGDIINNFN